MGTINNLLEEFRLTHKEFSALRANTGPNVPHDYRSLVSVVEIGEEVYAINFTGGDRKDRRIAVLEENGEGYAGRAKDSDTLRYLRGLLKYQPYTQGD